MRIKASCICLLLFSLAMLGNVESQTNQEPLIMANLRSMDTSHGKWIDLIYTEAFQRLQLDFDYVKYPPKRAADMLDKGVIDGDVVRVYSFEKAHPNVVRVNVPVVWSYFAAYAAAPSIHLDGWESLKGTNYRVVYHLGTQRCAEILPKVVAPENLSNVTQWSSALKKIHSLRADIFIGIEDDIDELLKKEDYKSFNIYKVGIMEKSFGYTYFHKKHRDLVPEFEKVLKDMTEEGLLEKYRAIAFGE